MAFDAERLQELFDRQPDAARLDFAGSCHDCGAAVTVTVELADDGFEIAGGAVYEPRPDEIFLKCDACFACRPELTGYQECEVYSRVVGYLRPVAQWNDGKQAEFRQRRLFDRALR
jgi:hypothetical protein